MKSEEKKKTGPKGKVGEGPAGSLVKNGPFYPGGKNGVNGARKVLQTG